MEKRILGRTGHKSTLITLGGASVRPTTRKESDAFIKLALDYGVNHIDVAPTYGSGEAERILGKWVKEYRKNLFIACKTEKRTKKEAADEFSRSLKNLQTDYFDLYQLHGLDDPEELEIALSKDGAIRAILDAKKQGLVKYIGITSHNPENIMKALKSFDFDTVLLPVNYVLHAHPEPKNDYEPVLALAKKRNLGVIAMKSVVKKPWPTDERTYNCWYQPFDTQKEVDEALWFTLSQYVTTAASSSDIRIAKMMIDAAERYTPMNKKEQQELLLKASTYKPLFPRAEIP
ncbi:MAG: aldo/keto reductase [Nitrososphaeria archaeon]|jgi:aryl-alcohol dehydrogenase-like predicted oxidoreductase